MAPTFDEQVFQAHLDRIEAAKARLVNTTGKEARLLQTRIIKDSVVLKDYASKLGITGYDRRTTIKLNELKKFKVFDMGVRQPTQYFLQIPDYVPASGKALDKDFLESIINFFKRHFGNVVAPKYIVYRNNGVMYTFPDTDYDEVMTVVDDDGRPILEN